MMNVWMSMWPADLVEITFFWLNLGRGGRGR